MKKRSLFQNKLFLAGVFVDARYCILLSEEQMEVAKAGLIEVALKSHHSSISVSNSSSTENAAAESIRVNNIIKRGSFKIHRSAWSAWSTWPAWSTWSAWSAFITYNCKFFLVKAELFDQHKSLSKHLNV